MFVHTKYSLGYGVKSPDAIIQWAKNTHFPFIVIADINTTTAIISSLKIAQEADFKIIAGADIRNDRQHLYHLIAKNNRGFHEINAFLSEHLMVKNRFPKRAPYLPNCLIIYPISNLILPLDVNEYVGVQRHAINQLDFLKDIPFEKCLAFPIMTFETKKEYNTHRLLRAITKNILLSQLPKAEEALTSEKFMGFEELATCYAEKKDLFQHTCAILGDFHCYFGFNEKAQSQNIATYSGTKEEDFRLLTQLCLKARKKRYPKVDFNSDNAAAQAITARIEHELAVVQKKDFVAYFLVTWDIVHYAQSTGNFHVGRGSGANSILAYLLAITDVDPLALDLYFERFINVFRKSPPDFDLDFSWKQRDNIFAYIFKRFPHTALLCTYHTYSRRSCIRELGKVLGLPKSEIDLLCAGKRKVESRDQVTQLVIKYSQYIAGLPSHLSIHAGGVIISKQPISWYGATFLPPKGFPTVQFSMLEAEDIGLYKFDILSQRGLSKIHEAYSIIQQQQPETALADIHDIARFKEDKKIQNLLQSGETIGCFYVESPAMRMLMKKLKTTTYLDLVAASSIIRPGVASSGMMKEYILRHKDKKRRKQGHPLLLSLMPETYGIMVYQEDVIKVAHYFGGLSLGEADILRRGMSGKYRSRNEFTKVEAQFFKNCTEKKYPKELTEMVWQQIESFAGYAFSKGHSASYAVESFQSLYLKAYFPLEYMVATLNNFGGYYATEFYVHEAQRLGAKIEAPCINNSYWETSLQGSTIYLGFQHIIGIDYQAFEQVLRYRKHNGTIHSFEAVLRFIRPSMEQLLIWIRIGAFRTLSNNKQALKWKVLLHYKKGQKQQNTAMLFDEYTKEYQLPPLDIDADEQHHEEKELLGFPLCNPFDLLKIDSSTLLNTTELAQYEGNCVTIFGYLVTVKYSKTKRGDLMLFGTFEDYWMQLFDTVHFPNSTKRYPLRGKGVYKLWGKVVQDFGYFTLEVLKAELVV